MKLKFYIFIVLFIFYSFACGIENEKENSPNKNLVEAQDNSERKEEQKKLPEISSIYVTHPVYFTNEFGSKEGNYSYKTVIFFENGEWGRVYSYTGIDINGKYISFDSSEGVEFGNWKNEKGKLKITIKQCKCHHCIEEDLNNLIADYKKLKQKVIEQKWDIQGRFGEAESFLLYKGEKYKYLRNEEIILKGLRDNLFEMDDDSFESVPCKILEK